MGDPSKAVFLSYASQDAEAAKRIADALRAAGVEVWFDQSELRGGDAWDQSIRKQIKACALFVPVVSANTQARREGYFRLEWKLADDRTHLMAKGTRFILPVCVDDTKDWDAIVPDSFTTVQWTRLPHGEAGEAFAGRVKKLLSGETVEAERFHPVEHEEKGTAPPTKHERKGVWPWVVVAVIALPLLYLIFKPRRSPEEVARLLAQAQTIASNATKTATTEVPSSPARQLVERARAILNQGSLTRAQLDAAGELCDRALQLDTTDALVWAEAARADLLLINPYGYDRSDERRKRAQERAARATSLGPDLFEVRRVQAAVFAHAVGTPALLLEAEKMFRELIFRHPDDSKLVFQLAEVLREQKRFDEAAKLFESVNEFEVAGWSYYQGGKLRAALADVERSLRARRSVTGLQLKALLQVNADEDLKAAQATIDQLQPSELLAEMPAAGAMNIAMYRRDPARVLEIAQGLALDYLDSNAFRGPRQFYTGLAHELAGRTGAAEGEWRAGLAVVQARLKAAPDDRSLLLWSAWLHAALNNVAEAERLFARSQVLAGLSGDTMDADNVQVLLRLRRKDALLAGSEAIFNARGPNWEGAHAEMRFSPLIDWERGDPRFDRLLRNNLPPGAKPLPDQKTEDREQRTAPAIADQRSVAVLAFANLSDDKANEYFSDGISEELLTVLQKIPGLHVAARTSAFSFKGKEATAQEIGQKLGVANLVEGSVRKSGNSVRITARLSRAATGEQLWSESYTRDLKDVFAVQSELAETIVGQLRGQLGGTATKREIQAQVSAAEKGGTKNPEAHERYLQGKYFANQFSQENLAKAADFFQRAVALDPAFAQAWAALARVSAVRGEYGNTMKEWTESFAQARQAVDRALALDPNLAEAQAALMEIQIGYDFDWRGARESVRRALSLAPSDAMAIGNAARLAGFLGEMEKSIVLGRQAEDLDPINPEIHHYLAGNLAVLGRFQDAAVEHHRALELSPSFPNCHASLAQELAAQGRLAEALVEAELEQMEWARLTALAKIQWDLKNPVKADEALNRLIDSAADVCAYQIAENYAHRRENDRAFQWLERAYRQHDSGLAYAKTDFDLSRLHDDSRWEAFMRKLGLADDQLK